MVNSNHHEAPEKETRHGRGSNLIFYLIWAPSVTSPRNVRLSNREPAPRGLLCFRTARRDQSPSRMFPPRCVVPASCLPAGQVRASSRLAYLFPVSRHTLSPHIPTQLGNARTRDFCLSWLPYGTSEIKTILGPEEPGRSLLAVCWDISVLAVTPRKNSASLLLAPTRSRTGFPTFSAN